MTHRADATRPFAAQKSHVLHVGWVVEFGGCFQTGRYPNANGAVHNNLLTEEELAKPLVLPFPLMVLGYWLSGLAAASIWG